MEKIKIEDVNFEFKSRNYTFVESLKETIINYHNASKPTKSF